MTGINKIKIPKVVTPFVVYIFTHDEVIYAVGRVKFKGVDTYIGSGMRLEKDINSQLNSEDNIRRRCRRSVVAAVSNTFNAILLYGKDVFDEDGNISWSKFQELEKEDARKAIITKLDIDKKYYDFKTLEIPCEQAVKFKMI